MINGRLLDLPEDYSYKPYYTDDLISIMEGLESFTSAIVLLDLPLKDNKEMFLAGYFSLSMGYKNNYTNFANQVTKTIINNLSYIRKGIVDFGAGNKQWRSLNQLLENYYQREPISKLVDNVKDTGGHTYGYYDLKRDWNVATEDINRLCRQYIYHDEDVLVPDVDDLSHIRKKLLQNLNRHAYNDFKDIDKKTLDLFRILVQADCFTDGNINKLEQDTIEDIKSLLTLDINKNLLKDKT